MRFKPKLFGKYFLLDRIAVGGTAEIFKAKSFGAEGFEKILAIKKILPHLARNKDFIKMLIDEAKIAVQLTHKNIVQVYDLGMVENDYFIAMEYIEGMNLRSITQRLKEMNKRLPLKDALYIVSEICGGLNYAHRKTDPEGKLWKIVHRDISPPNILLSLEGDVKIVDFGIAKAESKITETLTGVLKGKLAYMSPEQARCEDVDLRSDIFSTGIMLYELITNKDLFKRDSGLKSLEKIKKFNIEPEFLPENIPKELRLILLRALQKQPSKRYQSAKDLEVDIKNFMHSARLESDPDQLANLLRSIFKKEIKSKKLGRFRRDVRIPEKTLNIMHSAKQEVLVTNVGLPATEIYRSNEFLSGELAPSMYSSSSIVPELNPRNVNTYVFNSRVMTTDGNIETHGQKKAMAIAENSISEELTHLFRSAKINRSRKANKPKRKAKPKARTQLEIQSTKESMESLLFSKDQNGIAFEEEKQAVKNLYNPKDLIRPQKEGEYEFSDFNGPPLSLETRVIHHRPSSHSMDYDPYAYFENETDNEPTLTRRIRGKSPFQEVLYQTVLLFSLFFVFFAGAYNLPKILFYLRQLFLPFFE